MQFSKALQIYRDRVLPWDVAVLKPFVTCLLKRTLNAFLFVYVLQHTLNFCISSGSVVIKKSYLTDTTSQAYL